MARTLIWVACILVAAAPLGVAAGVALAVSAGAGVAAGSGLYLAVGVWLLTADLLPDPAPVEASR